MNSSIYYKTFRCPECGSTEPSSLFIKESPLCNACLANFLSAHVPTMEITSNKYRNQHQLDILKQGSNEEESE